MVSRLGIVYIGLRIGVTVWAHEVNRGWSAAGGLKVPAQVAVKTSAQFGAELLALPPLRSPIHLDVSQESPFHSYLQFPAKPTLCNPCAISTHPLTTTPNQNRGHRTLGPDALWGPSRG